MRVYRDEGKVLLICGSRDINITPQDIEVVLGVLCDVLRLKGNESPNKYDNDYLAEFINLHSVKRVITGGAKGPDTAGLEWARQKGFEARSYMARWEQYGKSAGILRNKIMAKQCDMCLAFWDGKSKGTEFTMNYTYKLGKKVYVVMCDNGKLSMPMEFTMTSEW